MIAIVDYAMGNLHSVGKGLEKAGASVKITSDPAEIAAAERIVVPGQGAFGDAAREMRDKGVWQPIADHIASGKPFLGICLGLQLLMEGSEEAPDVKGLGVLKGQCRRLRVEAKVPHMGWNELLLKGDCPILRDLGERPYCYFAHSYYVDPEDSSCVAATTHYEVEFPVVAWKDNVVAMQFHPEKSQKVGLKILENFLNWDGS